MSDSRSSPVSASEPGRPASRGRTHSQTNPSRRQPLRQQPPYPSLPSGPLFPPASAQDTGVATAAASAPPYSQGIPTPYQATPPFRQPGTYVGQYTMSASPVNMMHQSPAYTFPHHPGLHAVDTSMHPAQNSLLGYSPNTLIPMMQPPPVFPFAGPSPESSSSSSHSFSTGSPGPPALFPSHAHTPVHPSPPPHSPLSPQGSGARVQTISPQHSASYAGPTPYAPMRYPTPPFAYPPHSFAQPYASTYASYAHAQPYAAPEQEAQGTWWYLPHGARPPSAQYESFQNPYAMPYNAPMTNREIESYPQPGPSPIQPGLYSVSPRSGPAHYASSHTHAPESLPSTPPVRSTSTGTGASVPRGKPPELGKAPEPGPSSVASSSRSVPLPSTSDRPPSRRPYHPNPPAQRSEWVMWAGNVPADATHDELWRFFNQPPSPSAAGEGEGGKEELLSGGVSSIFLISRSNCAFINFASEAHLHAAIARFNGRPLRPNDPRCPRLVCRVRTRNDDLKAGVGGQRGAGIHTQWIREQKDKAREEARRMSTSSSEAINTPGSSPSDVAPVMAGLSLESDGEGAGMRRYHQPQPHSSSSGSHASTNSSILQQYFPKRYFILKSLTQYDLDLSVEKGLWATQKHNEGILDQAYRTSKDVYLIFGVNKSGEFYGYARMVGPVLRGEHRVPWASRADSPPQRRSSHRPPVTDSTPTTRRDYAYFDSPGQHSQFESPLPLSPDPIQPREQAPHTHDVHKREFLSAPPEMHQPHQKLSRLTIPHQKQSLDQRTATLPPPVQPSKLSDGFTLDSKAPARNSHEHGDMSEVPGSGSRAEWELLSATPLTVVAEEDDEKQTADAELDQQGDEPSLQQPPEGPVWGESFKVEWIHTDRLPFHRTKHLRNPWNHDREVKVSRDGTELEPSIGQALLDEWDRPDTSTATSPTTERRSAPPRVSGETGHPSVVREG
ncbi:hypothetical protein OBBRIDRAFT_423644 [Obba rivulosa]|uniref:YTH domain-containing protein n=1 Tax=Obba rivulosa TaxID=1052685 RepID=A0A8E2B266_9APHY|nr:hypothetical protein OBBRIDRAFT_423644 [Obba rivulosa]